MYKLLLCTRYLRTRYIALASIISVMLGVATMIVVNSVMAGFSSEMRGRIHGILSDMVLGSTFLPSEFNPSRASGSNSTNTSTSLSGPKWSVRTEPNRDSRRMWLRRQNSAMASRSILRFC